MVNSPRPSAATGVGSLIYYLIHSRLYKLSQVDRVEQTAASTGVHDHTHTPAAHWGNQRRDKSPSLLHAHCRIILSARRGACSPILLSCFSRVDSSWPFDLKLRHLCHQPDPPGFPLVRSPGLFTCSTVSHFTRPRLSHWPTHQSSSTSSSSSCFN